MAITAVDELAGGAVFADAAVLEHQHPAGEERLSATVASNADGVTPFTLGWYKIRNL